MFKVLCSSVHPAISSESSSLRTYLDHAATTALHPEVAEQICADLHDLTAEGSALHGANPAALHTAGRRASGSLAQARERVAQVLQADPHEVIFTSGGTESCALVVSGFAGSVHDSNKYGRILYSAVEHPAVADTARVCAKLFALDGSALPVDSAGVLQVQELHRALLAPATDDTPPKTLVSVMLANNETGVIQPVSQVAQLTHSCSAVAHTDATAAVGRIPVSFRDLGVDALSLSGHKIGAPVGVGALVARRDLTLQPPAGGGRQERGLRSGTQDVVAARALALALELSEAAREVEMRRLQALRDQLLTRVAQLPHLSRTVAESVPILPNVAHFLGREIDGEALLMALDLAGIDASAGSACHAGVQQPSHVLLAMGHSEEQSRATLRCSLGASTTQEDIERLLSVLPAALGTAHRAWQVGR